MMKSTWDLEHITVIFKARLILNFKLQNSFEPFEFLGNIFFELLVGMS